MKPLLNSPSYQIIRNTENKEINQKNEYHKQMSVAKNNTRNASYLYSDLLIKLPQTTPPQSLPSQPIPPSSEGHSPRQTKRKYMPGTSLRTPTQAPSLIR